MVQRVTTLGTTSRQAEREEAGNLAGMFIQHMGLLHNNCKGELVFYGSPWKRERRAHLVLPLMNAKGGKPLPPSISCCVLQVWAP